MLGRDGRKAVRQQIIAAIAVLDFDKRALLAEMGNGFGQQQLHAAVLALEDLIAFSGCHGKILERFDAIATPQAAFFLPYSGERGRG